MTEREPKPNIDRQLEHGRPDAPLFERLDESSQKFVAEVYDLSNMPEEEFLTKHPKIKEIVAQSKKFWEQKDASSPTIWWEIAEKLREISGRDVISPRQVADRQLFFATMQDLVLLHLWELKDFTDFGQLGFYGKQTDHLAEKILNRTKEMTLPFLNLSMPDALQSRILTIQQNGWPSETAEKIKIIHGIINALHVIINYGFPPALLFVKDLWRYAIIRMGKTRGVTFYDWGEQYSDFFNKLSNINLKK